MQWTRAKVGIDQPGWCQACGQSTRSSIVVAFQHIERIKAGSPLRLPSTAVAAQDRKAMMQLVAQCFSPPRRVARSSICISTHAGHQ